MSKPSITNCPNTFFRKFIVSTVFSVHYVVLLVCKYVIPHFMLIRTKNTPRNTKTCLSAQKTSPPQRFSKSQIRKAELTSAMPWGEMVPRKGAHIPYNTQIARRLVRILGLRSFERRRLPTLPHCIAVPSVQVSLTSLFGMGRGGTSPQ